MSKRVGEGIESKLAFLFYTVPFLPIDREESIDLLI